MTKEQYLQSKIDEIKEAQDNKSMRVRRFTNIITQMSPDDIMNEFVSIRNKKSDLSFAERSFIHRLCIEALMAEAKAKKEADKKHEIETKAPQEVVN